jgi:simple sugar transport system permease protein
MSTKTLSNIGVNIKGVLKKIPFSTAAVGSLYLTLLIIGVATGIRLPVLLTDSLHLFGVWAILVLAMVPSIQSGTGPNFALPVGVVCGLLAMVITLSMNFMGMSFVLVSAAFAIVFGITGGYLYGRLMNAVKGSEMAIAPYTGFAITFLFSIIWLILPIHHELMTMFMGSGLRHMIDLSQWNANLLFAEFLQFDLFGITFRTGELLIIAVACFAMWVFFRTKTGIGISAVGSNPMFAKATGINVDKSRIIANIISTTVGALGVIVYANGFGFVQLYEFPFMMAFPAVAAILVGGASARRAKISNVIIGAFFFQGLFAISLPVLGNILPTADIVNPIRMGVQNGIILYALTRMSGGGK